MVDLIIFPSSYFSINRVDEELKSEYEAAQNTGFFDIILFDYNKWVSENRLVLNCRKFEKHNAVYRGWMMKPDKYKEFYSLLAEQDINLVTSPDEYEKMHIFPNVYPSVKENTAKMEIFPLHEQINVETIKEKFSRFMVKDYVKSVKGTSFPKYFDSSVTQKEFDDWMEVFYKYRGNLLTGGICIKEYLDLKKYGGRVNEFRVFYINHEIATVSRNSGQINMTRTPPEQLLEKYRTLPSPYYTVDFAELDDDSWVVIEAGDGMVSGLSDAQDYEQYYRLLYRCFE